MNGVRVNTQLIAERRRELNMSERALIKLTGVTVRLVYSPNETDAESYSHGASMTLAELSRLASALAVSPTELLMTERPAPAGAPADDVAVVLAALMDGAQVTLTRKDDLASALSWPLERVERAASQAAEHLPALGLTLHHSPADGLGLRPRHGVLAPAEQRNLARAKTYRTRLRIEQAKILHDVAHEKFPKDWRRRLRANKRVAIQALRKRGLDRRHPRWAAPDADHRVQPAAH